MQLVYISALACPFNTSTYLDIVLVGTYDPTVGHQLFHIAIAEGESVVDPGLVIGDLGRKR
jgi:hypothetical protein